MDFKNINELKILNNENTPLAADRPAKAYSANFQMVLFTFFHKTAMGLSESECCYKCTLANIIKSQLHEGKYQVPLKYTYKHTKYEVL